jgi:hypothetical protein
MTNMEIRVSAISDEAQIRVSYGFNEFPLFGLLVPYVARLLGVSIPRQRTL